MTSKEAIEIIKVAIAEIEWNCPMNYSVAFDKAIEALHLLEKQEQGLVQILPCKVETPLYEINERGGYKCISARPAVIGRCIQNNLIGKTVFLTKEEAEAKLKEMGCENEQTN